MLFNNLKYSFLAALIASTAYAANPQKASPSALANVDNATSTKSSSPSDAKPATSVITLGTVTTDVEGDLTIITARLNRNPEWKTIELEEHGTFLQVKLPNTQIPNSGEFTDGNGPFLRKLASFQLGSEDGALRLFVNQDAAKAKLATTAELLGDRIVITIDHKKLEQLITPAKQAEMTATAAPSIADSHTANPAANPTVEKAQESSLGAEKQIENNLPAQLTKGAAVCAVIFLALLGFQFTRSRRGDGRSTPKSSDYMAPAPMRVLSTVSIGPKQKLTLVQVGHQQLLLGVTSDAINLITNVQQHAPVNQFSRALENANPAAEIKLKNPDEISAPAARKSLRSATIQNRHVASTKGSSVNVAVGEDGPVDMKMPQKTEHDITKILRDRLRNLPPG